MKQALDKQFIAIGVLSFLLVASFAGNATFFIKLRALRNDPQYKSTKENQAVLDAVRRLIVLPDEQPTIATVTDPDKLKNQAFFANAKVGDRVLIFTQAKKAILYDPQADRIIDVAPLNTKNEMASPEEQTVSDAKASDDTSTDTTTP